jgi:hypothetical protein
VQYTQVLSDLFSCYNTSSHPVTLQHGATQTTGPGITGRLTLHRCLLTTVRSDLRPPEEIRTLLGCHRNRFLPTGHDSSRAAMQARRLGRMRPGG